MSIPLPPPPEGHNAADWGGRDTGPCLYTAEELRARDLEVARVVLEAAANHIEMYGLTGYADCIRALEFHHAE